MRSPEVAVLFTTAEPTLAALKTARRLVPEPGAQIRLMVLLAVPYPLPISDPPVRLAFTKRQVRRLTSKFSGDARIELYLCRDSREALHDYLKPGSLVVIGGRRRWWWGGREQRLAHWLQENGHSVVFAAPDEESSASLPRHNLLPFRTHNPGH